MEIEGSSIRASTDAHRAVVALLAKYSLFFVRFKIVVLRSFSQNTRDLLYQMSDHLPIVAQLETSEQFLNTREVIDEPRI